MPDFVNDIIGGEQAVTFWKQIAQKLKKTDQVFTVCDFDYTIISRDEHFIAYPDLAKNRGDKGPKYLFESGYMQEYIEKFYTHQKIPKGIVDKLHPENSLILTAGKSRDFQLAKVRSMRDLDDFQCIVTQTAEEKIPELIRYVLFELREIPKEIIVYEDRPRFFVEHRAFIEEILGTKLVIKEVKMSGNKGYKKIEEI